MLLLGRHSVNEWIRLSRVFVTAGPSQISETKSLACSRRLAGCSALTHQQFKVDCLGASKDLSTVLRISRNPLFPSASLY